MANKTPEPKKLHWMLEISMKKLGELRHFRSIGNRKKKQAKIFYAANKVFVVEFENWDHVGTREIIRGPHDSLLPIEAEIEARYQKEGVL